MEGGGGSTREYIQGKFSDLLTIGDVYKVWFYLSPSKGGYYSNNFGAGFSTYHVNQPDNNLNITNILPRVNYTQVINDTLNWTKVEGTFIADSAYQYIIIGNFFDDTHTYSSGQAYFYIDDVHVELLQHNANGGGGVQGSMVVYPNPASNQLTVIGYQYSVNTIEVTDVLGRVVIAAYSPMQDTNGNYSIDISRLSAAIYFIKTKDENGTVHCNKFVKITN